MKYLFLLFATLILTMNLNAQEKKQYKVPDFELIEQEISSAASKYYYPALMDRYSRNDTTLTFDDFYYLYYGYTFQPNYKPLVETNYVDSINMIFSARTAARGDEFTRIIKYCKAILSVEPFNLRDINVLAYAYQSAGYKNEAADQLFKLRMVEQVIKSTGEGYSESSPWWIIYRNHAEDIMNMMKMEPGRVIIMSSSVEFIACKNASKTKIKGCYFNYSELYKRKPDYIQDADKPKRHIDINPNRPATKYELSK